MSKCCKRDEFTLPRKTHDQLMNLLDQLMEVSIWQDAQSKAKGSLKKQVESFMTNKLKLVRKTLQK